MNFNQIIFKTGHPVNTNQSNNIIIWDNNY